jgi:hypothetical protein
MKFKELIRNAFIDEHNAPEKKRSSLNLILTINKEIRDNYPNNSGIYLQPKSLFDLMLWPPNAFVICAKFLDMRGVYKRIISGDTDYKWGETQRARVGQLGEQWKAFFLSDAKLQHQPDKELMALIYAVFERKQTKRDIEDLDTDPDFINNLFTLLLAADESFKSIDSIKLGLKSIASRFMSIQMMKRSTRANIYNLSSCKDSFGTIQYKHIVCQSGISLNSLSHKLAFVRPDIDTKYIEKLALLDERDHLNILIFPWPDFITKDNFKAVQYKNTLQMDDYFGFFEFSHQRPLHIDLVIAQIDEARKSVGEIDLVVFPECAMSQKNANQLADDIFSHYNDKINMDDCPTIVTGIFKSGSEQQYGTNALMVYYASAEEVGKVRSLDQAEQQKHHRWFLDGPQIINYGLSDKLCTQRKWWEYIEVTKRSLISYYCERHDYQLSPLICEDLARQDPVAPVVRALGPNLIIALLLDGPQLARSLCFNTG